jgi:hypothetical protein
MKKLKKGSAKVSVKKGNAVPNSKPENSYKKTSKAAIKSRSAAKHESPGKK